MISFVRNELPICEVHIECFECVKVVCVGDLTEGVGTVAHSECQLLKRFASENYEKNF